MSPKRSSGKDGALKTLPGFSLEDILNDDRGNLEHPTAKGVFEVDCDEEGDGIVVQGFCVECEGVYMSHKFS